MKIYGHPWSINTRKSLMTLAEKQHEAEFVLVMIPKGEQKAPAHLLRHPFGKVPVLDDEEFVLYETRAINRYLDHKLGGNVLTPPTLRENARLDQWINVADSYFIPFAHPLIVEVLFRRFLGGEQNVQAIEVGRRGMRPALDAIDEALAHTPYLADENFSLADVHWMPYLEYLCQIGEGAPVRERRHVAAWWERVSSRPTWHKVARSGPQPYQKDMTAGVIEKLYRG